MLSERTLAFLGSPSLKWGLWAACYKLLNDHIHLLHTKGECVWLAEAGSEHAFTMLDWSEQIGRKAELVLDRIA